MTSSAADRRRLGAAATLFPHDYAASAAWLRIVTYGFMTYKLLSRDFSLFGYCPTSVVSLYPYETFPIELGFFTTGFPALVDLFSGHWIHWLAPLPGETTLAWIQGAATALCAAVLFFGRGPRNVLAIGSFLLVQYLWGFLWRSSTEIDGMFLPLQFMLLQCFLRAPEAWIVFGGVSAATRHRAYGWASTMTLALVCAYYGFAGHNKLLDIRPSDWWSYDLSTVIPLYADMERFGHYVTPGPMAWTARLGWLLDDVGVPLTYLMELTIPLVLAYRRLLPLYGAYFVAFHLFTLGHGILFAGPLAMWMSFVPVGRWYAVWRTRRASQKTSLSARSTANATYETALNGPHFHGRTEPLRGDSQRAASGEKRF